MSEDNYDDAVYDAFIKSANKDNRVGDHDWIVSTVKHEAWDDGTPRIKIIGNLITANNAKADLTISPPPPKEIIASEGASWNAGKKKAIASAIQAHRNFAKFYGKTAETIVEGDLFRVKTVLTKRNLDGTGGFVRVIAILDPKAKVAAPPSDSDAPPF